MLELVNQSPWQVALFPGWGRDRCHQFTLVVKQSFRFELDSRLVADPPGPAIEPVDRYRADPRASSLEAAAESMPFKQGGELLLTGTAHPPRQARVMEVDVALERPGAPVWRKTLRVVGERRWRRRLLSAVPSEPGLLAPTPLIYEYAFGGVDKPRRALDPRNPVGLGFARNGRVVDGQPLPRIEQGPGYLLRAEQQPPPAGFGPIPPAWEPRFQDQAQLAVEAEGLCPYPQSVPPALYNCAPRDQRFPEPFRGGERLTLRGFFPDHVEPVTLSLPAVSFRTWRLIGREHVALEGCWDTLLVDTDARRLQLVWRAAIPWSLTERRRGQVLVTAPAGEVAA